MSATHGTPLFVGACPRSGTTLLRTMLHAHPEVALPRETRFLVEAYERRARFGDPARERNRETLASWLVDRPGRTLIGRLGLDSEELRARILDGPPTLGSMLGRPFHMYAQAHGAHRWGDKRPMYVLHAGAILAMFPDAQFVNVVRDPRSAVASMRKLGWFDDSVPGALDLWLRSVQAAARLRSRLPADRYHEVRYEDLVRDPAPVLTTLCRFLGVDEKGVDAMLSYHEDVDVPENEYHWRVSQPVTDATVEGWRGVLTPEEVALVDRRAARPMAAAGYAPDPAAKGVSVPWRLSAEWAKRRAAARRNQAVAAAREARRRRAYPYPVEARLTSGASPA